MEVEAAGVDDHAEVVELDTRGEVFAVDVDQTDLTAHRFRDIGESDLRREHG